ncbi:hypothetical protein HDV03_003678 [Kappamyces sp. JEL0829]|nr:hypothetical protein HDV03_003678 [Kappamyces sp. JEL0829]
MTASTRPRSKATNAKAKMASQPKDTPTKSLSVSSIVGTVIFLALGVALEAMSRPYFGQSESVGINEFESLDQAFRLGPNEPFVVRNPVEFRDLTMERAVAKIQELAVDSQDLVFGYLEDSTKVEGISSASLIRDWHRGNLSVTVFDSPLQIFDLPQTLHDHHSESDVDSTELKVPLGQTIVLSKGSSYTPLHMDPLNYGGGWMYIYQGEKDWNFLAPEWADLLFDPETKWLHDAQPSEFLDIVSSAVEHPPFTARFKHVQARAGDFVYFPPAWMHRVQTFNKTIGLGGYIRPSSTLDKLSMIESSFVASGVMTYWDE